MGEKEAGGVGGRLSSQIRRREARWSGFRPESAAGRLTRVVAGPNPSMVGALGAVPARIRRRQSTTLGTHRVSPDLGPCEVPARQEGPVLPGGGEADVRWREVASRRLVEAGVGGAGGRGGGAAHGDGGGGAARWRERVVGLGGCVGAGGRFRSLGSRAAWWRFPVRRR